MKLSFYVSFLFFIVAGLASFGQAPNLPANPSPANQATLVSTNPNLCATVSDPNGGTVQVRYFGRAKPANSSEKFTIILLPDTQYYTEEPQGPGAAAMFNSQTAWIASNRQTMNIVYVGQLGDCTENGDNPPGANDDVEWQRVNTAISTLESPALTGLPQGIPYGLSVGNHDQTPNGGGNTASTAKYNQYFGFSRFTGRSYYGGHEGSNNDNHYDLFTASGIEFLVISMEYDTSPEAAVLDWAANLVQTHSNRKVIVMTHFGINETGSPKPSFGSQGQAIYDKLKQYPNFMLFVCGHIHQSDGEAQRTDIFNGNTVHTVLSDYQARTGGGNGLLRIMEFDPSQNKISVKTYSPFTNTFETDADSQFELSFNMLPMIGQTNNVSSGTAPCFTWSNLSPQTDYEWGMELYDGTNKTLGAVWNFTTAVADIIPPTVSSVTPLNGTTGVSVNTTASAVFNEAMNATTINSSTIELRNSSNTLIATNVSYNATTRTATLTPTSALVNSTVYTAKVISGAAGVKDASGNALASDYSWSFTTVAGDITPPTITLVSPLDGSTGVSVNTTASAIFNEAMNAATINSSTIELRNSSNALIATNVSYNATTMTATLTPTSALANSTVYTAKVIGGAAGVKDVAGNALASDYSWSFTTVAGDITPPTITSVSPLNGTTGVS
ncbi:MAG: Ig-like domain-containing protein, partial [Chitinophagales bacterium]